jgi:cell division septum initiation protein DivIVA
VALDRQSIEKKDFPIGRRGYDPQAVDAHLSALAEEVEELKAQSRRRSESLAAAASEQVRSIVEAAESTAAQIQREADEEAKEIRREARSEAKATREEATSQAGEYVSKVSETTATMLERLGAIEQELGSMAEGLRTGATRVGSDLRLLENNLVEVKDAVSPRTSFEPEPAETFAGEPAAVTEEATGGARAFAEPTMAEEPVGNGAAEAEHHEPAGQATDDIEGARLIALNMALNGTPRDEVDRYLAENFDLADRESLIEEVYASVEG